MRESHDSFLFCDYVNVWRYRTDNNRLEPLQRPDSLSIWNPTGLAFLPGSRRLLVANYTGHDVVVCDVHGDTLTLVQRLTWPGLISPENVSVFPPGAKSTFERIAVADFDASAVFVADPGGALIWERTAANAHGVAFGPDGDVWVTAPGTGEVLVFDSAGRERRRWGGQGWRQERYLWPMSLSLAPSGAMLLADAHVGALCRIDGGFAERLRLGENGPGVDSFNMPYHALVLDEGTALVADTYKRRLVWVDMDRGVIEDWVGLSTETPDHNVRAVPSLAGPDNYFLRQNSSLRVRIPMLARWGLPTDYEPGYSSLRAGRSVVYIPQQGALFGGAVYFVHATNAHAELGTEYALVFSPTSYRCIGIREDGACASVTVGRNFWVQAPGVVIDDAGNARTRQVLDRVHTAISAAATVRDPMAAAGIALDIDEPALLAALRSEPGRVLAVALASRRPPRVALAEYLAAVRAGGSPVWLDEMVVVGALSAAMR